MRNLLFFSIVITIIALSSCKEENKYRWTEIDINITSLTSDDFPDSIHFRVWGHKSGDPYLSNSDGSNEIDDYIINGNYHGGFYAKTSSRWSYNLVLDKEFRDSFYILPQSYSALEKRKVNNADLQLGKKYPLIIKSYLSSCTGNGDKVKVILKHKIYEPDIDVSQNSEVWDNGGWDYVSWLSGCDTNTDTHYCPSGVYEVGVKTIIQGTETGYFLFEYEVFKDSTNLLELYY